MHINGRLVAESGLKEGYLEKKNDLFELPGVFAGWLCLSEQQWVHFAERHRVEAVGGVVDGAGGVARCIATALPGLPIATASSRNERFNDAKG